jgi:hypothetical protein
VATPPEESRIDAVPLVPLSGGAFSVQLLLSPEGPGEAAAAPFFALSEEDEHSRVLLGALKGDRQSVVDFCAVKLVKNAYPVSVALEASRVTNATIEARFAAEADSIRALAGSARFAPRLIQPETGGGPPLGIAPLLFCKSGRRLFTPPCPRCAGPLDACRDEAALAAAKLPSWSSSLERFLRCPKCAADDARAPFYALEVTEAQGEAAVLSAQDLYRELGEALAGGDEGEAVRQAFPCAECVEAGARFAEKVASGARGAPFWEDRWWPLAFYGSPCVVTGYGDVGLEEFSDMLGGRTRLPVAGEKPVPAGLETLARRRYPDLSSDRAPRLLFEGSSAGLDAVEILGWKLAAFGQVVEAVLAYYRALGRPHLDVHPRHLTVDVSRPGEGLPLFTSFQVRLHGLSSAARLEKLPGAGEIVVPPRNPSVPYAPPEVLEFHLTPPRPAQVILSDVEEQPARGGGRTFRLHGKLTDPYGVYPSPRDNDWVLVFFDNEALGLPVSSAPCRRDPRSEPDLQELVFISEPMELDPAGAARLKKAVGARIPGVRYKVYAAFSAPSDIFSLGLILLRLLVGNDRQDGRGIASSLDRVVKRLGAAGQGTLVGFLAGPGIAALLEKDPEILFALRKANIFYQEIDRKDDRPNAIPDALWKRAILLALRMATRVERFSLCANPSDFDEAHPTAKLEQIANEVDLLQRDVRGLLFDRQATNVEIQQVLVDLLLETSGSERSGRRP